MSELGHDADCDWTVLKPWDHCTCTQGGQIDRNHPYDETVDQNFQKFVLIYCGKEPPHNMHQPHADLRLVCRGWGPQHEAEILGRVGKQDDMESLYKRLQDAINEVNKQGESDV